MWTRTATALDRGIRRPGHGWLTAYLAAGIGLAVVVNLVLPDDHGSLDLLYMLGIALGAAATVAGLVLHRPPLRRALGWSVVACGLVTYVAADALWISYARNGIDPFPSFADTLFFAGMTLMALGSASLATRRGCVDRVAALDMLIGAGAAFAVLWVVVVVPFVDDPDLTTLEKVVSGAYPLIDVLVVMAVLRLLFSRSRARPAVVILLVGLTALATADATYHLQELADSYVEWSWLDLLFMVALTLVGGAALHPSAALIDEVEARTAPLGTTRFLVLSGSAITPMVLLAAGPALGLAVAGPVVPVTGAVLVALVVVRTWSLMSASRRMDEMRGQRRFSSIIRNSSDAIVVVDADQRLTYVSPALSRMWGYAEDQLIDAPLTVLAPPAVRADVAVWLAVLEAGDGGCETLDTVWRRADGEPRHVSVLASDLRDDPAIRGIVLTARDVTQRVALEVRLRHEAAHDALTRVANRRRFEDVLAGLDPSDDGRTFVVFVDVDEFKSINDTYGHGAGDRLLTGIAARLEAMVRPGDLVARLGGDEFGVVLTDTDESGAHHAVQRIQDGLQEPFLVVGPPMMVGHSLGWTEAVVGDHETALRRADLAMYEAKRAGGSRAVRYTPGLLDAAERDLDLRRQLDRAVADEELEVHYQPIVDVRTGAVLGQEALLRWSPGGGERVPPDEFVPLAEQSGAILGIGRWILERACADAAGWPTLDGEAPLVSVNVSAVQLGCDGFAQDVARCLAETGLPGARLQLELTESVLADDDVARRFQSLGDLGVRLAIDDFGTGYGSLEYLRRFRVDVIKIDRSFVTDAGSDPSLLRGMVRLVRGLGVTALAEGVETEADRDLLRQLGVAEAQGWLFGRPTPEPTWSRPTTAVS